MRERFTGLWRHREFLKYWTASAVSDVGSQVTALALPRFSTTVESMPLS